MVIFNETLNTLFYSILFQSQSGALWALRQFMIGCLLINNSLNHSRTASLHTTLNFGITVGVNPLEVVLWSKVSKPWVKSGASHFSKSETLLNPGLSTWWKALISLWFHFSFRHSISEVTQSWDHDGCFCTSIAAMLQAL